jgi:hypothetical protein
MNFEVLCELFCIEVMHIKGFGFEYVWCMVGLPLGCSIRVGVHW